MKKIKLALIFIIGLLTFQSFSQTTDSLMTNEFKLIKQKILALETNSEIVQSNLSKCHKQWSVGLGLNIVGYGFSGIGTWLLIETNTNPTQKDPTVGYAMMAGGGLLSLIGTIVIMDSHKYIGKAGLSISKGGIVYVFK